MNKEDINWEVFAKALLWEHIVQHKNEDSGWDVMETDAYKEGSGICKGDVGRWQICSYVGPYSHRPLTWKELALELGLGEEFGLIFDGHDCDVCPNNSLCTAFFKGDKSHEQCNWWKENMNDKDE